MDVIDKFLTDTAPSERRDLFMSTYNHLVALGHVDHELNIENFVGVQGDVENDVILLLIENELVNACHDLALKYFIVCRKEERVNPYNKLLEFLDYIENTIESETLLYHLNDELDAREQLLTWVDVFRNDLTLDLSDFILDVMPSLIENITQVHELKVDHEVVEFDELFAKKIQYVKALRQHTVDDLIALTLIRSNLLKTTYDIDVLFSKYANYIYAASKNASEIANHVISIAMFSPNDMGSINHDAKRLLNLLYDDVKVINIVSTAIDEILNQSGELCKTMNTI